MAHNPAWVVNKHPNDLKAQIKELVTLGYTVTVQDATSAQLIRKKSFSCLFAIITGVIPYFLYYMWKQDGTIYLDLENQHPDPAGVKQQPNQAKKIAIIVAAIFFGIPMLAGFISALTSPSEPTPAVQPIVDAPHILTLTIEEARKELGTPTDGDLIEPTAQQLRLGTTTWNNSFDVKGYSVVLDYNVKTREVTEFFIATNEDALGDGGTGETRDWKPLAKLANMDENATTYSVKPVQIINKSGYYTGVTAADLK